MNEELGIRNEEFPEESGEWRAESGEIKQALELCGNDKCRGCKYALYDDCGERLSLDALRLIKELEEENRKLREDMFDTADIDGLCTICAYHNSCAFNDPKNWVECSECTVVCACKHCSIGSGFKWRGDE